MNEKQFNEITEWQRKTFPVANALSKIAHLKQEIEELRDDIKNDSELIRLEFADCFMLLMGAAKECALDYADIVNAINEKMEINKKRKWGKPDENGVVKHIKE